MESKEEWEKWEKLEREGEKEEEARQQSKCTPWLDRGRTHPGLAEQVAFEASGSTGANDNLVPELLPDPWHSQEDGGPDFIEGGDNGSLEGIGLGKPHCIPTHHRSNHI